MSIGRNKETTIFERIFCFLTGLALIGFGGIAIFSRTYFSINFGDIDLGKYHIAIGVASIIIGATYTLYFTFKDLDIK